MNSQVERDLQLERSELEGFDDLGTNDVGSFMPHEAKKDPHKEQQGDGSFSDRFWHPDKYLSQEDLDTYLGDMDDYYRKSLQRFAEDKGIRFNWAVFLLGPIWILWRKMFKLAIGLCAIDVLFSLGILYSSPVLGLILRIIGLVVAVFFGCFGNQCYFYSIQMRKLKAETLTGEAKARYIKRASGFFDMVYVILIAIAYGGLFFFMVYHSL